MNVFAISLNFISGYAINIGDMTCRVMQLVQVALGAVLLLADVFTGIPHRFEVLLHRLEGLSNDKNFKRQVTTFCNPLKMRIP